MKNWLKYLLLFWVLIFSTGFAMAQYVTIGGANGTTAYLMRTWTEDGKSQLTFSNNILNWGANILTVGDTIYSIGWNVQSVGGQVMYNANINIIESGSATSVWAGKLAPIIGWNDILLDVPYVRTGTGNLIVEYCFDNCNQTSTTDVYRTQTSTNTFAYRTGNNANGCSYTPNQQNTVNRPNTRFGKSVPGATYTHDTICSGTSITLSSNSSLTLNTSISGFTYHGIWNGNYYFQSNNSKTWLAADLHCQSAGGHLVHIDNAAENTHVNSIINGPRWIGYYQNCNSGLLSEPAGGFEWTDGTIGTYTNWDVGVNQPNNGTSIGEEYTMMYTSGIWHDYNANTTSDYVMEIEETYLWNTGDITSTITVSPTTTTTYWVDHSFGTNTEREYFNVVIGIEGCTNPLATNYDPLATCDDGSCITSVYGCTDPLAVNYDPAANTDDGSCAYFGCTHRLELYDLYGDGWNGATVDLEVNGSNVSNNTTVSDNQADAHGFTRIIDFVAITGDNISLDDWFSGSSDDQIVWAIKDGNGNVINSGMYGDGTTNVPAYCAPCKVSVYDENFETLPFTGWNSSQTNTASSYTSSTVLGEFIGNPPSPITLNLGSLPSHDSLSIEFDLYIISSWDGNGTPGPDNWDLELDNIPILETTFSNSDSRADQIYNQLYPNIPYTTNSSYTSPNYGSRTGASQVGSVITGFSVSNFSLYEIKKTIPHTSNTATFDFFSNVSGSDEVWAIDNVKVYILSPEGCTDPAACNYDPLATCDDGSCVYDVSIVTTTNVCTGVCDGEVSVAVSPITPGTNYTYTIDGGSVIPYSTNTNSLCAGNHSYEFFIDGSTCGVTSITVGEYPAMTLQTTVVDSTCDSSYAFVSTSVASSSGGNVSTLSYCASSPATNAYSNIELVRLVGDGDSISNNTSGLCDDYEDYTAQYTTLTAGQSYSVEVNLGSCSSVLNTGDSVAVFIDWNQNGLFTDAGERVGISSTPLSVISFFAPNNGSYGATRMRVVYQLRSLNPTFPSGPIGSCDVGDFGTNGTYDQPWRGATEDYSIVISNPTTLTNATYLWSPSGGIDSIANNLAAGTYTVTVTDANGCTATETAIVGATLPLSVIANSDQTICNGNSPSSLNAISSSVGTYSWTDALGNPLGTGSSFAPGPLTTTTTYTVTFTETSSGCTATDSVIITVNPLPVIISFTASPSPACVGDTITLQAITSIPVSSYIFLYASINTSGNFTNIANTPSGWQSISPPTTTPTINFSPIISTTSFKIKVKDYGGCPTILYNNANYISVIVNPIVSSPIYHN